MAVQRVANRVKKGGHHIPEEVVKRRFYRGIWNLLNLYIAECDSWTLIDNRSISPEIIVTSGKTLETLVKNNEIWDHILRQSKYGK